VAARAASADSAKNAVSTNFNLEVAAFTFWLIGATMSGTTRPQRQESHEELLLAFKEQQQKYGSPALF
jgi:hypothetical protein